jgi:DNA repair protein RadC
MKKHVSDMSTLKTLLADTLREKPNSYTIEEIFTRFPSIQELIEVTEHELMLIKGIGPARARQIISAFKLATMLHIPQQNPYTIRSPKDVYEYVRDMQYLTQEHLVVLGLNTKNHVLFRETVFIGSLNSAIVHPREIFKKLIRRSCCSGVIIHNHPSGSPIESIQDIQVTKRLCEVGDITGIEILDHIIIGHDCFVSLKEKGHM